MSVLIVFTGAVTSAEVTHPGGGILAELCPTTGRGRATELY